METLEQPLVSARNEPIGEGLINQPIGYFQIAADDFMDTLADMDYLLFDKYNYSVVDMSYSSFEKNQTAFGERSRTAFRFPYKHDTETQHPENIISADSVRPDDILMGQGQTHQMRAHRGNVIFRDLVDKHFFKYDSSTSKVQKTKISKTVVSYIAKKNGRFLEPYKLDCEGVIEWKHLGDDERKEEGGLHLSRNSETKTKKQPAEYTVSATFRVTKQ